MKKTLTSIITIIIVTLFPTVIFAQAPNLGTAANFVLFSSNGAVTNSGISQLTGNVGTNSGSSTGFGNVNGVMNDNNGISATCASDLLIAYGQLNSRIPTAFPAPLLGNGDTLNAGVYRINAVTTLSGSLTLNAQGNSNAVFIFQIQAAFSTAAAAKIKLINGAQACNVFWKIEGAVTMATATFFSGTVIANNAAIIMTVNDTLEGRALSTTGAVTVQGVLAYTPVGCGSPLLTGPTAPTLGATACYALFSANGSVTNSGITFVTGDVGTNVGLTNGFNASNVSGTIHPIPNANTSSTAAALQNVNNYLNTLTHDIQLLYPAQFGNNLVLTPHTYLLNAATSFTGTVFLNAQGNPNAVFVLKINGALTTSTFSKVILTNGAQAKNVFWKVEGAVTINNNSVFNGTLVCNNGAINLNTGDSIIGRAFTLNGALNTFAINANNISGSCNALPVNWLYFNGKSIQKNVLLQWGTTNEINNDFFTIDKSKDGITFETLATVNANATVQAQNNYYYTDQQPYTSGFYRIAQTDKTGKINYFKTIQIKQNKQDVKALHFVQENYIYLQTSGESVANASIHLYNIEGKIIITQKIILTKEVSTYKIQKPIQKGMYILYLESKGEKIYTGKVMVL